MASRPAPGRRSDCSRSHSFRISRIALHSRPMLLAMACALAAAVFLAPPLMRAQSTTPHISGITPGTGKAEDSITISGENLGKDKVAGVFLSDAKLDHKAVVVDQEATKIVIKVPDGLKAGDYNISVQEGGAIYIQPVIFVVKT